MSPAIQRCFLCTKVVRTKFDGDSRRETCITTLNVNNTLWQIFILTYAYVENVLEAYVLGACKTLFVNGQSSDLHHRRRPGPGQRPPRSPALAKKKFEYLRTIIQVRQNHFFIYFTCPTSPSESQGCAPPTSSQLVLE